MERSGILDMTGVIEIGLKSAGTRGVETLGRGRIVASFHCRRATEDERDKLNISTSGTVKNGTPIFKNQAGISSSPVTVSHSLSRMLKSRRLVNGTIVVLWLAVLFTFCA
jgi:hypothetical protein